MNFSSPGITVKYVAYNMAYMTCHSRSAYLVAIDWPLAEIFPQLLRRPMSFQNLPELLIILSFVHLQQLRDLLNSITTEWNDVSELRQNEVSNKFPLRGRVGFSGHVRRFWGFVSWKSNSRAIQSCAQLISFCIPCNAVTPVLA